MIGDFGPDILGVQEALHFQIEEVRGRVTRYGLAGVGRDDGATRGEYSAILYDTTRVELVEQGTFWFSDSPAEPGSMSAKSAVSPKLTPVAS